MLIFHSVFGDVEIIKSAWVTRREARLMPYELYGAFKVIHDMGRNNNFVSYIKFPNNIVKNAFYWIGTRYKAIDGMHSRASDCLRNHERIKRYFTYIGVLGEK